VRYGFAADGRLVVRNADKNDTYPSINWMERVMGRAGTITLGIDRVVTAKGEMYQVTFNGKPAGEPLGLPGMGRGGANARLILCVYVTASSGSDITLRVPAARIRYR
jgi:hypothetical protein